MATLTRRAKSKSARGLALSSSLKGREPEAINTEALRGIISYLSYLYSEGEISDKAYKALVSQVLSTFVENSIRFKIERILDKLDQELEKAEEVLLDDILV
ncbi:hypothetical protein PGN35_003150 [Nodosilinea sp. PGN35]|uniref:hypothetical protein n=1 Tax=Nodosilinea sp. PGN35 TaxID=3020489 RepID=UPI0023B2A476|nr:hypothetical protein [Nodosilinea sp. TSF1-S3]MDF0365615.1 hypothetical protein [Nodosilinea sp. TSF1-S3]